MSRLLKFFALFVILNATSNEIFARQDIASSISIQKNIEDVLSLKLDPYNDLVALPSAQGQLQKIQVYLDRFEILQVCKKSKTLAILRERLISAIFHLNFLPEIIEKNKPNYLYMDSKYPYDPVFLKPFPKRPSLEVIEEAIRFINNVAENSKMLFPVDIANTQNNLAQKLIESLKDYGPYKTFAQELNKRLLIHKVKPKALLKEQIIKQPVDSYLILRRRLIVNGEIASFPEFADSVDMLLSELNSIEVQNLAKIDPIFKTLIKNADTELKVVTQDSGKGSATQAAFSASYPYRRTIHAIEQAIAVFDTKERLQYKESKVWHEVEESWYLQKDRTRRLLLPLYHFNRYKYQLFGLLSNPNIVLLPWNGDVSLEDLIRLRPVPIGLIGVMTKTYRVDRHHNSPLDFWYHDINHIRRMWGYDKRSIQTLPINNWSELMADMYSRQAFIEELLKKTDPKEKGLKDKQRQVRFLERFIIFETFHETALSATKDALLNDLTRRPATPQPFEVQIQDKEFQKELNRQFDGNLKSGADVLPLILSKPTKIQYFFDRAPGFLSNVYNKIAWGFHTSVFLERINPANLKYRTPEYLAEAANHLFCIMGYPRDRIPSQTTLISEITDRSGQPELYNYFALHNEEDLSISVRTKIKIQKSLAN
jgi:hypothetical protein